MSESSAVTYTRDGMVAIITINRPERMNRLDAEIVDGLHDRWVQFMGDDAARVAVLGPSTDDVEFCRTQLAQPREELDPLPWVTGDDLVKLGLRPGRGFAQLLQSVRVAQLDGIVATPEAATELALRLAGRLDDPPTAT